MTCNHGFFLHDCALCEKRPGECDYGSCTEPATVRLVVPKDPRALCEHHAAGYIFLDKLLRDHLGSEYVGGNVVRTEAT